PPRPPPQPATVSPARPSFRRACEPLLVLIPRFPASPQRRVPPLQPELATTLPQQARDPDEQTTSAQTRSP
ncbi:Unknown protein, partial [Striga hermonthica]